MESGVYREHRNHGPKHAHIQAHRPARSTGWRHVSARASGYSSQVKEVAAQKWSAQQHNVRIAFVLSLKQGMMNLRSSFEIRSRARRASARRISSSTRSSV